MRLKELINRAADIETDQSFWLTADFRVCFDQGGYTEIVHYRPFLVFFVFRQFLLSPLCLPPPPTPSRASQTSHFRQTCHHFFCHIFFAFCFFFQEA